MVFVLHKGVDMSNAYVITISTIANIQQDNTFQNWIHKW